MEEIIELISESEEEILLEDEPFLLAQSQSKTVDLSMANGDQVISPDAGYLLSQVIVRKPATMKGENIREGVNIGGEDGTYAGIVLDPLTNPASPQSVLLAKEYYDDQGIRREGEFVVPTPPPLTNPAGPDQILLGYDALVENNERVEGTFNPNVWSSTFLVINHTTITVGPNSVNTTLGVKDYVLDAAGIENGRILAFSLREKPNYVNGEIGRCVLYPNSGIGYFSCTQWNGSSWVAGRMLSGYSAVLPVGNVYDVYYWGVPT